MILSRSLLSMFLVFAFTKTGFSQIVIKTENAPIPVGPYSQAIKSGNTLYVSGQIGVNPATNKLDSSDFKTEARQVLKNHKAILEAANMSLNQVVKTTVYLTNLKDFGILNEVFSEFFPTTLPARETIQAAALPKNAHIEISIIAVQ